MAGYENFAACVTANSGKKDPKAYCATIMRAVEKAEREDVSKEGKTKTVSGTVLHASDFAHVGDPEDPATWKLPIHDASHVRNALARLNQTEGINQGAAKAKIVGAAHRYGIKVGDEHEKGFRIAKVDEAQRLVFGWASVAIDAAGETLIDLQGDMIDVQDLEKAAYDFMLYSRTIDEMHKGPVRGQLVESFMVTPDKLEKIGLANVSAPEAALWIGAKLDPDSFAKVLAGDYPMFSIEGRAERVEA